MSKTAAILIIGNEVLSGRTREKNAWWLSTQLTPRGIHVRRVHIIPDDRALIAREIQVLKDAWDYVIVCGGIGPTPDDVTRPAVADAFNRTCVLHPEAAKLLQEHYGERCTPRRMVMAEIPEGAALLENPVTVAPGFFIDNVFVLPGIPELVEAMFPGVVRYMEESQYAEVEFAVMIGESEFADIMEEANTRFPGVEIGSYPQVSQCKHGWRCSLVVKGGDTVEVQKASQWLRAAVEIRTKELHR